MKEIYTLINAFTEHLQLMNRSERTIEEYHTRLKKFAAFLATYPIASIHDITADHIHEYQRFRHYYRNQFGRHDTASCQNVHMSIIKSFFAFLKSEGYLLCSPAAQIKYKKEPKKLPKPVLTNSEVKKLLRQPDTQTLVGYRDRTILELLYSTGLRRDELLALTGEDVDCEEGYVRVNQGKGNKDRMTPLGKIAAHYLETYLKAIRPLFAGAQREQALFFTRQGTKLSRTALADLVSRYAEMSGLKKHITPHTLRRSCATEMIKHKANLMHVKELLGHASINTVQAYCNLSIIDLKEAHRKCHPREKDKN